MNHDELQNISIESYGRKCLLVGENWQEIAIKPGTLYHCPTLKFKRLIVDIVENNIIKEYKTYDEISLALKLENDLSRQYLRDAMAAWRWSPRSF